MNDNIHFHIDLPEDGKGPRCGSANIFSGWVANTDDSNPIESVQFVVKANQLGTLQVKQERPDLMKMFGKSMLGFIGAIMIPEDCKNSTLEIVAVGKNGTRDVVASYLLNLSVQADEVEFKKRERIPDDMLRHLVVQNLDPHLFLEHGKRGVEVIKDVLAKNSIEYRSFQTILDFGVGCGRIMRWWEKDAGTIAFWGTDINEELIAWCRENLPFARFSLNALSPPMQFDNESIDFLYAFSVFTHLGLDTQKKWLPEFGRVLTPGGTALISVHGDEDARSLDEGERRLYTNNGFLMRTMNAEGENMCAVYQNQSITEQLFGEDFEVVDFLPGARPSTSKQDLYLIRKR